MPKPLADWLNAQMRLWKLTGNAVLIDHGKTWHRFDGEAPGWADCGTWIPASMVRQRVGKGEAYPSPLATSGNWGQLCGKCFAEERPLIDAVLTASGRHV
jgi:hypothetical protein